MISVDAWQEIDYLAFHENAILLDVKLRSQGDPIRSVIHHDEHIESPDRLAPQLIRNVLDDFALEVSGEGGKDNVSAVCMEHDEELRMITLRVSSNDGIQEQKLADLQGLLHLIAKTPDVTNEVRCEEVLTLTLQQCATVFLRHVNKILNELKQARCPPDRNLRFPVFPTQEGTAEPSAEITNLGSYNTETPGAYMQLASERLSALRRISADLTASEILPDLEKMGLLAKAAYDVQRSSCFDRFLRYNLLVSQKPIAVQSMAQSLKERLGKMSRFWRAAKTLTAFGSAMLTHKVTVNVLCLPASRHMVRELGKRTPAQLQARGGQPFRSCNDGQLQTKLAQWQSYRLHCEMQLVVFYQENPHLQLRSRYIGCSKLACHLCYNFITNHGQFQLKGCHQGLYSLWTVPLTINFEKHEQAIEFNRALKQLAHTLARKVDTIRKASKQWKYRTNHESTANLSRISLQWPITTNRITEASTEASDAMEPGKLSRLEKPSGALESIDGDQNKCEKFPQHTSRRTNQQRYRLKIKRSITYHLWQAALLRFGRREQRTKQSVRMSAAATPRMI
ncbi:hypothetical protein LTR41_011363 [Exophiala xenobiotica]|nr:hypothetical protein LTR41_011363 [Exophiala xenobiotica]KAK5550774.1 hypothetical protein LTR46_011230 [Exophiala xenobiotica]